MGASLTDKLSLEQCQAVRERDEAHAQARAMDVDLHQGQGQERRRSHSHDRHQRSCTPTGERRRSHSRRPWPWPWHRRSYSRRRPRCPSGPAMSGYSQLPSTQLLLTVQAPHASLPADSVPHRDERRQERQLAAEQQAELSGAGSAASRFARAPPPDLQAISSLALFHNQLMRI